MSVYSGPNTIQSGLVLHLDAGNRKSYPGTGTTWFDLSGNNNHGTLTNGPTFNSANGGSIVFDGTDDTVSITDNSSLDFGTNNFTISCFLYIPSTGLTSLREYGIINKNTNFANTAGWGIELSTWGFSEPFPNINIQFYNTGQTSWGNSNISSTISTNTWNYFAAVRNSTSATLYLNNNVVVQKTNSQIGTDVNNNSNIIIGDHTWGPNFKGNFSQILIHNRALSQIEINQNFNATRGRYGI